MAQFANNPYRQMLEEILAAEMDGGVSDGDIQNASPDLAAAVSRYAPVPAPPRARPMNEANPSQSRERSVPPKMAERMQGEQNRRIGQELSTNNNPTSASRPRPESWMEDYHSGVKNAQAGNALTSSQTDRRLRQQMDSGQAPYQLDPENGLAEDLPILEEDGSEKGFMQARIDRLLTDIGGPENLDGITLEDVEAYMNFVGTEEDSVYEQFDNLDPQTKMQVIQEVIESDGLASFGDVLGYRAEEAETYGRQRMQ